MSAIAPAPFGKIVICPSQVREYRRLLARNLLPKQSGFQAPRRHPRQLAQQLRPPADRRAPALLMPTSMPQIQTIFAAAAPLAPNPM
jgi:hypothetical protein